MKISTKSKQYNSDNGITALDPDYGRRRLTADGVGTLTPKEYKVLEALYNKKK